MVDTIGYIGLDHSHRSLYLESLAQLPVEVTCVREPDESFDVASVEAIDLDDGIVYSDCLNYTASGTWRDSSQ